MIKQAVVMGVVIASTLSTHVYAMQKESNPNLEAQVAAAKLILPREVITALCEREIQRQADIAREALRTIPTASAVSSYDSEFPSSPNFTSSFYEMKYLCPR